MRKLVYFALAFVAGTLLCQYLLPPTWRLVPGIAAVLAFLLALVLQKRMGLRIRWLPLAAAGLILGLGWFSGYEAIFTASAKALAGLEDTVTVELGATEEMAVDALTEPIGEYRLRPDFDSFSFAYTNTDQDLVKLATKDRLSCLHNLITIRFTDGSTVESGVALAQDLFSTLVRVEVSGGSQVDEETMEHIVLYILEGMEFTGPTEENYQEMYHLGREEGYTLVGIALVPTPYEEDPFLRVPLPYGGEVTYLEDGGVLAQAHGLRIQARACWSPEGPQAIVEEAWAQVQAENRDLYQDGIFDSEYDAETDVATKQFSFWEGDEARISFLVAQPMRDEGRYRFMEVTYIPEEMDDDYPTLIQEFSHASDLYLPELEPF